MANIKSAKKRILTSERARLRNKSNLSKMRTLFRKVEVEIAAKNFEPAMLVFKQAMSFAHKLSRKKVVRIKTISRRLSRMNTRIKAIKT